MSKIDNLKTQVIDYNIKRNAWSILAVLFLILCGLSTFLLDIIPIQAVIALIIIFAGLSFFSAFKIRSFSATEKLIVTTHEEKVDYEKIRENLFPQSELCVCGENGAYIINNSLNSALQNNTSHITISEEKYAVPEEIVPYVYYLKEDRNKELKTIFPDKTVMGLDTELTEEILQANDNITMYTLTRSSVQVTDDSFNKIIINEKDDNKTVFDGRKMSIDENGHIKDIKQSSTANEVDIHGIVLSNDNKMIIAKATDEHPLYANQAVSCVSCSLLQEEITDDATLNSALAKSIRNKLHVLYDIPDNKISDVKIIGMSRIISRNGAPEFYAVITVDQTAREFMSQRQDIVSIHDVDSTYDNIDDIKSKYSVDELSVSLSALLKCVENAPHENE